MAWKDKEACAYTQADMFESDCRRVEQVRLLLLEQVTLIRHTALSDTWCVLLLGQVRPGSCTVLHLRLFFMPAQEGRRLKTANGLLMADGWPILMAGQWSAHGQRWHGL